MVLQTQRISHADTELFEVACRIRQQVFLEEYGLDPKQDTEPLDFLPTTLHFLGFDTEIQQYVAVARSVLVESVKADPTTSVQLGRIAVLPQARGHGHGFTIMKFVEQELRQWENVPVAKMFLFSIPAKCAFYERCGFSPSGHTETVRELLLHEMVRYLDPLPC